MNYREKSNGWSMRLKVGFLKDDKIKYKRYENSASYYYQYFEYALTIRESCYKCPFAKISRVGDITLGDYWGIERYHSGLDTFNGVSAVLINNEKGKELLARVKDMVLIKTKVEWITENNGQLRTPSACSKNERLVIFDLWKNGGAEALANNYKISSAKNIRNIFVMYTPYKIKDLIKKIIREI
jgi:hypothetical protein